MKRILFFVFLCLCVCLSAGAQALSPVTWTAYGLTFKVPKGIVVEEDTEETFLLNDSKFYITVQALDSDGITKGDLEGMLKDYADDDGVEKQTAVKAFDLEQFYGVSMDGQCEGEPCCYACLMTKAAGSAFHVSIIYSAGKKAEAEAILKSFVMEE